MSRRPLNAARLHRLLGLGAGLWLLVLGGTGFLLDHRHEWRWLWQSGPPAGLLAAPLQTEARQTLWPRIVRHEGRWIAAGPGGVAEETGAGRWRRPAFPGARGTPWVKDVMAAGPSLFLATDDGLWSYRAGALRREGLAGQTVTGLARRPDGRLLVVTERSRVLMEETPGSRRFRPLPLDAPAAALLPPALTLNRLVRDLHYGRGLVAGEASLWINDAAALALVCLPLTGLAYWALPRYFRARRKRGEPLPGPRRARLMRSLHRLHGPSAGLVLLVPTLWLAPTGILLDHAQALRQTLNRLTLPQALLPPVYGLRHWRGEIRDIAVLKDPQGHERLWLATRQGLFSCPLTGDACRPDRREHRHFITGLQQGLGIAYGMGGPNLRFDPETGTWRVLPGRVHMPTAALLDETGRLLLRNRRGLFLLEAVGARPLPLDLPTLEVTPWHAVLAALHDGRLFTPLWRWINDLAALALLLLAGTGAWRLWRRTFRRA